MPLRAVALNRGFKWEQLATYQAFHSKVDLLNNLAVSSPRREYRLKLL